MGTNIHLKYYVLHKSTNKCLGTAEILKGWEKLIFNKSVAVELLSEDTMKIVENPKIIKTKNEINEQGEFVEDIINHIKEPLLPTQDDEENMHDSTDPLNADDNMSARLDEGKLEQMLFDLETKPKVEEMEVKVDPSSVKMEPTEASEVKEEKWRETGQSLISQYCDKILPYCKKCKGSFPSLQENLDHWRKIHPEEPVQFFCRFQDCDHVSDSNMENIKNHIKEHLVGSGKIICCPLCQSPQLKKSLAKHVSNCIKERTKKTQKFKDLSYEMLYELSNVGEEIKNHWRSNIRDIPVGLYVNTVLRYCSKCDQLFPKYEDVVTHWRNDHSDEKMKFACRFFGCGHSCNNDAEMKEHVLDHRLKAGLSVNCPFCGKTFAKLQNLEEHIEFKHSGLPLEETKIGKTRKNQLKGDIKCSTCDKTFQSETTKRLHIENVHLRTSFNCKLCDSTFNKKGELVSHTRKAHKDVERQFKCHICDKSFLLKHTLKDHMAVHEENQQEYRCEECGKSYKDRRNLKDHIDSVHKKIFKYHCDQCDFKCTRRDLLNRHMIDHMGVYPFNCSSCKRGFKSEQELKNHEDTHLSNELKYKFTCQYCGSMFTRKVNMDVHIKSHHLSKD